MGTVAVGLTAAKALLPNPAQLLNVEDDPEERWAVLDVAEGVGFEPTDSLLSSAFKALALGHYANPPERTPRGPARVKSGRATGAAVVRLALT